MHQQVENRKTAKDFFYDDSNDFNLSYHDNTQQTNDDLKINQTTEKVKFIEEMIKELPYNEIIKIQFLTEKRKKTFT